MTKLSNELPIVITLTLFDGRGRTIKCYRNGRQYELTWDNGAYRAMYMDLGKLQVSNADIDHYLLSNKLSGIIYMYEAIKYELTIQ